MRDRPCHRSDGQREGKQYENLLAERHTIRCTRRDQRSSMRNGPLLRATVDHHFPSGGAVGAKGWHVQSSDVRPSS
jgi:hypothetical protein